jgi:hypothetical protein
MTPLTTAFSLSSTQDMQMVCRHSTCDLASTTNILQNATLSAKCTVPGKVCCTYDLLLSECACPCACAIDSRAVGGADTCSE